MALPPSTRKIPIIGGTIYKIGQVYDIVNTPCDADPWLWVYGFWHEVPMIFAMLFLPDPIDTVQDRFGRPHHRKRKYRGKAAGYKLPDINPGKGLGWAAWKMTEWIDRVGWYLLIADVSVEFALNWTSTVYKWAGCPLPGTPYRTMSRSYGLEQFPGDWSAVNTVTSDGHIFRDGGVDTIVVPAGYTASFMTAYEVTPRGPPYNAKEFETRILCQTTGQAFPLSKPKPNSQGQYVASDMTDIHQKYDHDRVYTLQKRSSDSGLLWSTKARFAAYGGKKMEGLIPWLGEIDLMKKP